MVGHGRRGQVGQRGGNHHVGHGLDGVHIQHGHLVLYDLSRKIVLLKTVLEHLGCWLCASRPFPASWKGLARIPDCKSDSLGESIY